MRARRAQTFPVVIGEGFTPVPIPNTVVKSSTADGTAGETSWESRSLPGLLSRPDVRNCVRPFCFFSDCSCTV